MQSAAAIRQVSASVIGSTDVMMLTQFVHEPTKPAKMAFADMRRITSAQPSAPAIDAKRQGVHQQRGI